MLLPQTKEREYRFKLALRMGLPIFSLVTLLIIHTFINTYENLNTVFYVEAVLVLVFSIYFILFLIYNGFDVKITDSVTKSFTKDYLYEYLNKKIASKKGYTLMLISVDNLNDINTLYGIKNGDKVLFHLAKWLGDYLQEQNIYNFPLGHIKGGDFIIGLEGDKNSYKTIMELLLLKSSDLKVSDIELKISAAICDTNYSDDLEYMIEYLFDAQEQTKNKKADISSSVINPNELELLVIDAIKNKKFMIITQDVFDNTKAIIKECTVKLLADNGKILHQKSYMKVVNRLGLGVEYNLMILEQNLRDCNKNNDEIVALSISPRSLRNPMFIEKAKDLLRENEDAKNKIIFLLSEVEYYSHIQKYNAIIKSFKKLGVLFAIDKLGSLHTSFLYLRDLDIDIVRFDTYYTKNLQYKNILAGFIKMAQDKGVKTWIKMIEDEDVKELAQSLGVDYFQGKYLAPLEKI